jgi:2-succinyl-5-enolpyruvyl-6-hydroxy-3-cyclohexene-1-carboxylate synthase
LICINEKSYGTRQATSAGAGGELGYCESFNSKLKDEFLNPEIFYSIKEPQLIPVGLSFVAKYLRNWLADTGARTHYIEPNSPSENGVLRTFLWDVNST